MDSQYHKYPFLYKIEGLIKILPTIYLQTLHMQITTSGLIQGKLAGRSRKHAKTDEYF